MGLLDGIFGNADQTAALGLLGAGLMSGNPGAAFGRANQYLAEAPGRRAQMGLLEARLQAAQQEMADRQRQQQFLQGLPEPAAEGQSNPMQQMMFQGVKAGALPLSTYLTSMQKDNTPLTVAPGASLVDRNTLKPVFTAPKEQTPTELSRLVNEMNALPPGSPLRRVYEMAIQKSTTHQPATTVNVSTEKSYGGEFGKLIAQQDAAAIDAARSAPLRIQSAQQIMRILDTQAPITGSGAEARLAVNKALSTAGLIDGQSVKSTEDLASLLASQTLDAIKSSGLGGGQGFTDKDRQFLERARSGNIEMNAGTLRTLAALNERAARNAMRYGNQVAARLRKNPDLGFVTEGLGSEEPPAYAGPSVVRKPPSQAASGRSIDDLLKKYGQ